MLLCVDLSEGDVQEIVDFSVVIVVLVLDLAVFACEMPLSYTN